jgi:hypothetical protein
VAGAGDFGRCEGFLFSLAPGAGAIGACGAFWRFIIYIIIFIAGVFLVFIEGGVGEIDPEPGGDVAAVVVSIGDAEIVFIDLDFLGVVLGEVEIVNDFTAGFFLGGFILSGWEVTGWGECFCDGSAGGFAKGLVAEGFLELLVVVEEVNKSGVEVWGGVAKLFAV